MHTPGPFKAHLIPDFYTHKRPAWAIWKDGVRLAVVDARPMGSEHEEEANAKLFAHAPAMLEALQEIEAELDMITRPGGGISAGVRIKAALEQARAILRDIEED